nr:MAG TPA: hypothetical protein [Caudoviricetes sp.]
MFYRIFSYTKIVFAYTLPYTFSRKKSLINRGFVL